MDSYLAYYVCGTVAGTVGTLVSHPFFTIKTKLQNNEQIGFKHRRLAGNFKFLYTGFTRACIGYGIEKTLIFGSYNSIIEHCNLDRNKYSHSIFAGFSSGVIGALSIAPAEQLTIDKQRNIKNYSLKHLYQGLIPTIARESVGFSIYFTVYDQLSKKFNPEKQTGKTMIVGTVAIVSAWSIICPFDKIKTNIQSNVKIDVHDIATAYKGFQFALMRAIPFHVTCFVVFEHMMKKRNDMFEVI